LPKLATYEWSKGSSRGDLKREVIELSVFLVDLERLLLQYARVWELMQIFLISYMKKNGILTGKVGGDMMFGFSKGDMLERLQNLLGIDKKNTLVVGDGANDLSMFEYAKIKVAFCAKPILKENATHIVDIKDLREILKIRGNQWIRGENTV